MGAALELSCDWDTDWVINVNCCDRVVVHRGVARRRPGSTGFNIFPPVSFNVWIFKRINLAFCLPFQLGTTLKEKEFAPQ